MTNRTICVLDAMPGAGKTEYFVEHAANLINSGKKDRVLVYAAPTTFLLEEVVKRVLEKVTVEHKTVLMYERQNLKFANGSFLYKAYGAGEAPSFNVRSLVSGLFGVPDTATDVVPAAMGSIIMLTHEGLLRLPKTSPYYPPSAELLDDNSEARYIRVLQEYNVKVQCHKAMTKNWKSILPQCILYFDEARSCILKNSMLELDRYQIGQLVTSTTITWMNALPKFSTPLNTLLRIKDAAYSKEGLQQKTIEQFAQTALKTTVSDPNVSHFVPPVSNLHNADTYFEQKMRYYKNADERDMETHYLSPFSVKGPKEYSKVHGYVNHTSLPKSIKNFFMLWKDMGENGRADFILAGKFDVMFLDRDDEDLNKDRKYIYYLLINPHSLFESFGKTIIMSAFFKDSQMYHMLARDAYTFDYALEAPNLSGALARIRERDTALRKKLEDKLQFAFLIDPNPSSPVNYNVLSSAILNQKMLFPKDIASKLERTVKTYKDKNPNLRITDHLVLKDIFDGGMRYGEMWSPGSLNALRPYAIPPLLTLAKSAFEIAKEWSKSNNVTTLNNLRNKTPGPKSLMLCMTNSMDNFAPDVKRSTSDYAGNKTSPFGNVQPLMLLHDAKTSIRDRWNAGLEQRDREERYASEIEWCQKVVRKYIELPIQTRLHGLNEYTPYSVFAHLASLNLPPPLARMLKSILPDYDGHQDNVIENLVQTMYRTQLRSLKPEYTDKVLLIVAFKSTARLLFQKLGYTEEKGYNESALNKFLASRTFAQEDLTIPFFNLGKEARIRNASIVGKANLKYTVKGQYDALRRLWSKRLGYKNRYQDSKVRQAYYEEKIAPIYAEGISAVKKAANLDQITSAMRAVYADLKKVASEKNLAPTSKSQFLNRIRVLKFRIKRQYANDTHHFEANLYPIFEKAIEATKASTSISQLGDIEKNLNLSLKKARSA